MTNVIPFPGRRTRPMSHPEQAPPPAAPCRPLTLQDVFIGAMVARLVHNDRSAAVTMLNLASEALLMGYERVSIPARMMVYADLVGYEAAKRDRHELMKRIYGA